MKRKTRSQVAKNNSLRLKSVRQTPASLQTLSLWHKKQGEHDHQFLKLGKKLTFSFIERDELVVLTVDFFYHDFFLNGHSANSYENLPQMKRYFAKLLQHLQHEKIECQTQISECIRAFLHENSGT